MDLFGPVQVFNSSCTPREEDGTEPDTTKLLYKVIFICREKGAVATGPGGAGPVVMAEHGIDMTLALVADLDGEQVAANAASFIEHHRIQSPANDKFAYLAGA